MENCYKNLEVYNFFLGFFGERTECYSFPGAMRQMFFKKECQQCQRSLCMVTLKSLSTKAHTYQLSLFEGFSPMEAPN